MTEESQPILAHLEELRRRIIKAALGVVVASFFAFFFREQILELLQGPYRELPGSKDLIALKPTEGFSAAMRIAFFGGLVLSSPVLFYQLWAFVNPALTKRERRWTIPIVASLVILFGGGVWFAYWILPRGLGFLREILQVEFQLTVGEYLSFVTRFLIVFGVAFEFPVFLFAAAAMGAVSSDRLAAGRRWAVVIIVTVSAMVTPTGDPYTLLLLSGPLYLMYELTIWLVRWILKR